MTLCAPTNPDPIIEQIERQLSWSRLAEECVDSYQFIREVRDMFRNGLNNLQAAHLLYQIGGVINVSGHYAVPSDRFAIRNFALSSGMTWVDTDFKTAAPLTPEAIGKFYASFAHLGARLPKKIHQFMRDKIREYSDAFLPEDGTRIIEYYATTADHISPSVFEVAVKAVEKDSHAIKRSREAGFLKYLAILDSLYDEGHFPKGFKPKDVFSRNIERFSVNNIAITGGAIESSKQWFANTPIPLVSTELKHLQHSLQTADRLKSLGFDVYSDFNRSAMPQNLNGIDFTIGVEDIHRRVGIIHDTAVKYVEGDTFPRVLYPNGRTIFNTEAVKKSYPDQVIVRLSTIAMNRFHDEVIGKAVDMAFEMPPEVYGLNENAQLQPIRKLSFKS